MMEQSMLFAVILSTLAIGSVLGAGCGNATAFTGTGSIDGMEGEPGSNCTWTLNSNGTMKTMLYFSQLNVGSGLLNVYGKVNLTDTTPPVLIANVTSMLDPIVVVSQYNVTQISLTSAASGASAFTAYYDTNDCSLPMTNTKGNIPGITYLAGTDNFTCTFTVTKPSDQNLFVVMFNNFNMSNADVSLAFGDSANASLSGPTIPDDQLGMRTDDKFVLTATFNTTTDKQDFSAYFETVNGGCSGKLTANSSDLTLTLPSSQFPTVCYAQITAPSGQSGVIYINDTVGPSGVVDNVVYYDGLSQRAAILGNNVAGSKWLLSSGKTVSVVAYLGAQTARAHNIKYRLDGNSKSVNLSSTAYNGTTSIPLDGATVKGSDVILQFSGTTPMIKIELSAATLTAATVTLTCSSGTVYYTFTKDTAIFPVTIDGGATVKVQNLTDGQKVTVKATSIDEADCDILYSASSSSIVWAPIKPSPLKCSISIKQDVAVGLDVSSLKLCSDSTLQIFQGLNKDATQLPTIFGKNYTSLPQIYFPASNGLRLVWTDKSANKTCSTPTMTGRYWPVPADMGCSQSVSGTWTTLQTPNYPNFYPVNAACSWTVPAKNSSMVYVSVKALQILATDSLVLKNSTGEVMTYKTSPTDQLPADLLIPNSNTSLSFSSAASATGLTLTASGAQVSYKVLDFGGIVSGLSGNLSAPNVTQQSMDALWIVKLPKVTNATNILNATLTVKGNNSTANGKLQVLDGNTMLAIPIQLNATTSKTMFLSRTDSIIVQYTYENSTSKPLNFTLQYNNYTCVNVCKNGLCMQPGWWCNYVNDCGDNSDETIELCGNRPGPPPTTPSPQPTPAPKKGGKGASAGWLFFCIVLGIILGIVITVAVPRVIRMVRLRQNAGRSGYGTMHEDA